MYMHPASFTDELLEVFAEQPEKFTYLDMPFQHIDTQMLSEMKRMTTEASLRELLATGFGNAKAPETDAANDFYRWISGRDSRAI